MKDLRTLEIDKICLDKIEPYISAIIDEVKNNKYVEGVYYIGSAFRPTINLAIVYNDYRFDYKYPIQKRNEIIQNTNMDLRIETYNDYDFYDEKRKIVREAYPFEFMLRYGTILYDRNGKLESIKKQLENDPEIESYLNYWHDVCKFEPPLQLLKK